MYRSTRFEEQQPLLNDVATSQRIFISPSDPRFCGGRLGLSCFVFLLVMLSALSTLLLVVLLFYPLYSLKIAPDTAQLTLSHAIITFNSMSMESPTNTTVVLENNVTISNAGIFEAIIRPAKVNLHYNGTEFGSLSMAKMEVHPFQPTTFVMRSKLFVSNSETFRQCITMILKGESVIWRMKGKVHMESSLGFFELKLDKDITVSGKKPEAVNIVQIQPTRGRKNVLYSSIVLNVINHSFMRLKDSGPAEFEILKNGLKIGELSFGNLNIGWGKTFISGTSKFIQNDTNITSTSPTLVLNEFISKWISGESQTIQIRGPTSVRSSFLLDSINFEATVQGLNSKLFERATIDQLEGVNYTLRNPFELGMTSKNISMFSVRSAEENVASKDCPASKTFPRGSGGDSVLIPPTETSTIYLETLDGENECDLIRPLAALCYLYHSKSISKFSISCLGTMILQWDLFEVNVTFFQEKIPFSFGGEAEKKVDVFCALPGSPFLRYPICFQREGLLCYDQQYWVNCKDSV